MLLATKRKSDFAPCACAHVGGSGTTMYRVFSFHGRFVLQGQSLNFWSGNREKANNRKYGIVCDTVKCPSLKMFRSFIFVEKIMRVWGVGGVQVCQNERGGLCPQVFCL